MVFERNVELRSLNTLALPAIAARLVTIVAARQLPELRVHAEFQARRRLVLGGGSNVVLTGDFDGLVLRVAMGGRHLAGEDADAWYVRSYAGENWHEFVSWTLQQGWPGLENLSLIPGTVGAAPVQNIGAYGLELGERLHSLEAYDLVGGELVGFDRASCRFGYRDSRFKQEGWHLQGRYVVVSATFRLPKNWLPVIHYAELGAELESFGIKSPNARQIADAVMAIRRRKLPDPALIPNAGSFFQNPVVDLSTANRLSALHPDLPRHAQGDGLVKLAAGWLIERAGWKGRDLGTAGMFEKQALVLVNRGVACGRDVLALAQAVQADVKERFGVVLKPEPVFV